MKNVGKNLLVVGALLSIVSLSAPSAEARSNPQSDLNQLVQAGLISPQQASTIESRAYGGGGYGGGFLGSNPNFGYVPGQPSYYDANTINGSARLLDSLHGDRLISEGELNALKNQLVARVKMVNENQGGWNNQSGWNTGYGGGYPVNALHPNPFHPNQFQMNQFHPNQFQANQFHPLQFQNVNNGLLNRQFRQSALQGYWH